MPKKKQRKRYTEQFKAEAVKAVENRGTRTIAEMDETLGVPEHMLYAWRTKAKPAPETNDRQFLDAHWGAAITAADYGGRKVHAH